MEFVRWVDSPHELRLHLDLILVPSCEDESLHAQDLQVGSVVPQQMGGEVLAHAVLLSTDQADVLVVNLEPAVNLPRHLGGEEALLAMPALLRS